MPDQPRPDDRSAEQRAADHVAIGRLADALVPALMAKLGTANLGEVEVREGGWHVRVRRPLGSGPRRERPYRGPLPVVAPSGTPAAAPVERPAPEAADGPRQEVAVSPAVGVFRPGVPVGTRVRAGDRVATVDLLGIALDVVAPIAGTISEVFPQSGDGVEYGEQIALVRADDADAAGGAADAGDGAGEG